MAPHSPARASRGSSHRPARGRGGSKAVGHPSDRPSTAKEKGRAHPKGSPVPFSAGHKRSGQDHVANALSDGLQDLDGQLDALRQLQALNHDVPPGGAAVFPTQAEEMDSETVSAPTPLPAPAPITPAEESVEPDCAPFAREPISEWFWGPIREYRGAWSALRCLFAEVAKRLRAIRDLRTFFRFLELLFKLRWRGFGWVKYYARAPVSGRVLRGAPALDARVNEQQPPRYSMVHCVDELTGRPVSVMREAWKTKMSVCVEERLMTAAKHAASGIIGDASDTARAVYRRYNQHVAANVPAKLFHDNTVDRTLFLAAKLACFSRLNVCGPPITGSTYSRTEQQIRELLSNGNQIPRPSLWIPALTLRRAALLASLPCAAAGVWLCRTQTRTLLSALQGSDIAWAASSYRRRLKRGISSLLRRDSFKKTSRLCSTYITALRSGLMGRTTRPP